MPNKPAEWLKAQGHGFLADLARRAGLSYNTAHEIFAGKRRASARSMIAIQSATGGAVTVTDLIRMTVTRPARAKPRKSKRRAAASTKRSRPRRTRARAA